MRAPDALAAVRGARSDLRVAVRHYLSAVDDLHVEVEGVASGVQISPTANAAIRSHNDRMRDLYGAIDAHQETIREMLDVMAAEQRPA